MPTINHEFYGILIDKDTLLVKHGVELDEGVENPKLHKIKLSGPTVWLMGDPDNEHEEELIKVREAKIGDQVFVKGVATYASKADLLDDETLPQSLTVTGGYVVPL